MFKYQVRTISWRTQQQAEFCCASEATAYLGRGPVYKSRIVNPPKKRARGPLLRVDPDARVTRYFAWLMAKELPPAQALLCTGGNPKKSPMRRSHGHRDKVRRVMGDMTDFDKILPQADGNVNGKCPIKRTEWRESWYKHPRGPAVPSADTR